MRGPGAVFSKRAPGRRRQRVVKKSDRQKYLTLAQQWKDEGIEIGKEEGTETTKWTIARKSLKMGLDIDSIAEITGLPESKIKLLASKMNIKKTGDQ